MKLQTTEWFGKGFVDFDHDVIGGKIVDGERWFVHVRVVGTGRVAVAGIRLRSVDSSRGARTLGPGRLREN